MYMSSEECEMMNEHWETWVNGERELEEARQEKTKKDILRDLRLKRRRERQSH